MDIGGDCRAVGRDSGRRQVDDRRAAFAAVERAYTTPLPVLSFVTTLLHAEFALFAFSVTIIQKFSLFKI